MPVHPTNTGRTKQRYDELNISYSNYMHVSNVDGIHVKINYMYFLNIKYCYFSEDGMIGSY